MTALLKEWDNIVYPSPWSESKKEEVIAQNQTNEKTARKALNKFLKDEKLLKDNSRETVHLLHYPNGNITKFQYQSKFKDEGKVTAPNNLKYAYYSFGGMANGKTALFELVCKDLGISLENTEKFDSDTFEAAFNEVLVEKSASQ